MAGGFEQPFVITREGSGSEGTKGIPTEFHGLLWGLFGLGFLLRGFGVGLQPPLADEALVASIAVNYLENGWLGSVMWYHPPLRNLVVFLSGKLFGSYDPWGLRFGSVFLGSLTVPLAGYLAWSLFRSRTAAVLAAFFLAIDPLHIYASREAFQFSTDPFFIMAGLLAAFQGIRRDDVRLSYAAGILFGLATASKWHGLFPWFVSALSYWAAPWLIRDYPGERRLLVRTMDTLGAYVAVPVLVYVACYLPWLMRGHSLEEFARFQAWLLENQYRYVGSSYDESVLPRRAWQWFVWPAVWMEFVFLEGKTYLSVAVGNVFVWFLTIPSLVFGVRRMVKTREFDLAYLCGVFLCSYLPLVLTTRSIWAISASSVIPVAFVLNAYGVSRLRESETISKKLLGGYLCAALLFSLLAYPMVMGRTLDFAYLKPLAKIYSPH